MRKYKILGDEHFKFTHDIIYRYLSILSFYLSVSLLSADEMYVFP